MIYVCCVYTSSFFFFSYDISKLTYFRYPRWNFSQTFMSYINRPVMYYVYSRLFNRKIRMPTFMRNQFPLFINSLEKTLHIFLLNLFTEVCFKWNIFVSFSMCWMYSSALRSVIRRYYKSKNDISNIYVFSRSIEVVQSNFAIYIFRTSAYCSRDAVSIGLNSVTDFFKLVKQKTGMSRRSIRYFSASILSCQFNKIAQDKRRFSFLQ